MRRYNARLESERTQRYKTIFKTDNQTNHKHKNTICEIIEERWTNIHMKEMGSRRLSKRAAADRS